MYKDLHSFSVGTGVAGVGGVRGLGIGGSEVVHIGGGGGVGRIGGGGGAILTENVK